MALFRNKHFVKSATAFVQKNGPPTFMDSPRSVSFIHPGPSTNLADGDIKPGLFYMMNLCNSLRNLGLIIPCEPDGNETLLNWTEAFREGIMFIASMRLEMSRDLYGEDILNVPLKVLVTLGSIGTASCTDTVECFTRVSKIPLIKMTTCVVSINRSTRKPLAFPEWFRSKYAGKGAMEERPFRVDRFNRPHNTFIHKTQVTYFDAGFNKHTNFATYVRFAIDAVHKAASFSEDRRQSRSQPDDDSSTNNPRLENGQNGSSVNVIPSDIVNNGVKDAKVCFISESLENDVLLVHVWHHKDFEVRCSVEKENGQECCQISLEYFSPISKV